MDKNFIGALTKTIYENNEISLNLYEKYDVKRGLRHKNGTGVLVGLTKVGSVQGYRIENGCKIPERGKLYYRNYEIEQLAELLQQEKRFSFEKTMFLLLFGELPSKTELKLFVEQLNSAQQLPEEFVENFVLRKPSSNLMNQLQRLVLCLYTLDDNPEDTELSNLITQTINIIAKFPSMLTNSYNAYCHKFHNKSLVIHQPQPELSMAENILHMLRHNQEFTKLESETLDLLLVIHAEHGGGNNSTFTSHVVSSTGTDTYSTISAAIGSLKGPKHGGANGMVAKMMKAIKEESSYHDDEALRAYLQKMIQKEAFDKSGLIYGMGHAIYTMSDPRADLLKVKAEQLARENDLMDEYKLYTRVEKIATEVLAEGKDENYAICANVDFYSSFVYQMLKIPQEMYTPLFATARIASWNAHRIEQLIFDKKIIRPAYRAIDKDGNLL